jgi:hypothetical protein
MRLVTRSEFAAIAGVSKPAITKACRGLLRTALSDERLDLDSAAVAEYLGRRGVPVPSPSMSPPVSGQTEPDVQISFQQPDPDDPADIDFYREMPFGEVVERFGTSRGMRDWLAVLKDLDSVREKRLKFQVARGELVSRDFFAFLFGFQDACDRHLLTDGADQVVGRLFDIALSGGTREVAAQAYCEVVSQYLKRARDEVAMAIKTKLSARLTDLQDGDRQQSELGHPDQSANPAVQSVPVGLTGYRM